MKKSFTRSIKYAICTTDTCCPLFRHTESGWLLIFDDFGGQVKIKADKELLLKTIEKLFEKK
jgi:hypothetical protein